MPLIPTFCLVISLKPFNDTFAINFEVTTMFVPNAHNANIPNYFFICNKFGKKEVTTGSDGTEKTFLIERYLIGMEERFLFSSEGIFGYVL